MPISAEQTKERNRKYTREFRARNLLLVRERERARYLKRKESGARQAYVRMKWQKDKLKMTPADRARRVEAQRRYKAKKKEFAECTGIIPRKPENGQCAICDRIPDMLVLDHDHATGAFRGYLCRECNLGLGKLGDNLESILKVVAYLRGANAD